MHKRAAAASGWAGRGSGVNPRPCEGRGLAGPSQLQRRSPHSRSQASARLLARMHQHLPRTRPLQNSARCHNGPLSLYSSRLNQAAGESGRASKRHRRDGRRAHHAGPDQHLRGAGHHRVLQRAVLLGLRARAHALPLRLLSEEPSHSCSCKLTSRPRLPLSTFRRRGAECCEPLRTGARAPEPLGGSGWAACTAGCEGWGGAALRAARAEAPAAAGRAARGAGRAMLP